MSRIAETVQAAMDYVHNHEGWRLDKGDLDAISAAVELGEAWAEVEKALPEGWWFDVDLDPDRAPSERYCATAARPRGGYSDNHEDGYGPTPAAALHALAVALQSQEAGE